MSQYAVWFVISDGNGNELWNGLGKLFWFIFVLRNGPDKSDSNNGNEHVGMQKRC